MNHARAGEYLHRAIEQGLVTFDTETTFERLAQRADRANFTEAHTRAYHMHMGASLFDSIPINPCQELQYGERHGAVVSPSFQEFHLMEEVEEL